MNSRIDSGRDGDALFQPRYVAFLETVSHLRSRMHRYCARMTGSAMDGEDVMQEALFEAYQILEQFDNSRALKPWLFRIVHNRCIDFLRRRQVREDAEATAVLEVLRLYVERFNRHDWDGVRELASADARLRVADCFAARLADSPYFIEYERRSIPWHMALGVVDGEVVVIIMRDDPKGISPFSVIRMGILRRRIVSITDYVKCSWLIDAAVKLTVR